MNIRPERNHVRCGFTLIEALVVAGVLAILASLLVPALAGAKRRARDVECRNNLRQQFLGLHHFASSQGVYPMLTSTLPRGTHPEHNGGWMYLVQNTIAVTTNTAGEWRSSGIWRCPSHRRPSTTTPAGSYGYNAEGLGLSADEVGLGLGGHHIRRWSGLDTSPVAESEVVSPSLMLALGDAVAGWKNSYRDGTDLLWRGHWLEYADPDQSMSRRVTERHGGRIQVAYCDGHVGSPKLDSVFADEGESALQQWNRDNLPHRERLHK